MKIHQLQYLDPVMVSKLKNLEVKAKLIVEGFITGLHRSPYHGFSVEFAEHRQYNPGESLRNVDWKVFGKTDKMYIKRYEEETNLRCHVVLDISDSMRYPTEGICKLEYGAYLAAALQYLMIQQRDAAGLVLYDDKLESYVPAKARLTWLIPMFAEIEKVLATKQFFTRKTDSPQVLHQIAQRLGRRGLVVIITDLLDNPLELDAYFEALQHIRHAKHEILVFHLLDRKTEEKFELPDQPFILQDLETGEEIKVLPQQIREEYVNLLKNYQENFKNKCRELKIDLVEVDIAQTYDKALLDYLIKRKTLLK